MLEPLNRQALALASEVAQESGCLLAGNLSNTNIYEPEDQGTHRLIRAAFEEQVGWAADAGVDYVIGETLGWLGEALMALEAIRAAGLPAVITMAIHRAPQTREGLALGEAARRLEQAGAAVVGLNCIRGPATMLPLIARDPGGRRLPGRGAAGALSDHRRGAGLLPSARSGLRLHPGRPAVPDRARALHVQSLRDGGVRQGGAGGGRGLHRGLLRGRAAPHPGGGRSARAHPAGQPLRARHDAPLVLRHRCEDPAALQGRRRSCRVDSGWQEIGTGW